MSLLISQQFRTIVPLFAEYNEHIDIDYLMYEPYDFIHDNPNITIYVDEEPHVLRMVLNYFGGNRIKIKSI